MAKRKQSRKQRAAALKNLRKARSARKRPAHAASPRRRRRRSSRRRAREGSTAMVLYRDAAPRSQPSASKPRKRKRSSGKRRTVRRSRRRLSAAAVKHRRGNKYRTYKRAKRRGGAKTVRVRVRLRRHSVRGHYKRVRGGKTRLIRRHMSYDNPLPYAMENPLTAGEVIVGGIIGVVGYAASNLVDALLATHAVKPMLAADGVTPVKDANGNVVYQDAPTAGQSYNIFAQSMPMDWKRWAAGTVPGLLAIGASRYVSSPMGRTTLQFFGFGYVLRTVGKGATDLLGWALRKTALGQRVYAPQIEATQTAKLQAADPNGATQVKPVAPAIPAAATGLLGLPAGAGACCGNQPSWTSNVDQTPPQKYTEQVQPPGYTPVYDGGGYVAQPPSGNVTPPRAAPPAPAPTPAPVPRTAPPAPPIVGAGSPFHWGTAAE